MRFLAEPSIAAGNDGGTVPFQIQVFPPLMLARSLGAAGASLQWPRPIVSPGPPFGPSSLANQCTSSSCPSASRTHVVIVKMLVLVGAQISRKPKASRRTP